MEGTNSQPGGCLVQWLLSIALDRFIGFHGGGISEGKGHFARCCTVLLVVYGTLDHVFPDRQKV